jgi:hypothetical protein
MFAYTVFLRYRISLFNKKAMPSPTVKSAAGGSFESNHNNGANK